jgi:hypothetical protein
MTDRLMLGKNEIGSDGFWVSKPGANVLALVGNSYLESLGDWYVFQEEFTGNGSAGDWTTGQASSELSAFGIEVVPNTSGGKFKPTSNGTVVFSVTGANHLGYFNVGFDNNEFIGSEYPIIEMRVRLVDPNNSANPTATDSASFPDVAIDFTNAPIGGGANPINHFKSGRLSGNTVNSWENTPTGVYTGADYSLSISSAAFDYTDYPDYQTDGKYTTIFSDSEYRILQWDMSSQDTWMDPYKYITEYDTGNNPHPYSGQYRINQLLFYLNRNGQQASSGNQPIWEIDYVRVKKKGVPKDAGSYGSVQDALIFSTDWMHTGLVHQTGTVTIGTQKAKIDGTTSDKLFSDTTRTTSNGVVSFPELPYIPLVLFQRIDPTGNTAYPGGEKEFSIASTEWENHTYPNTNIHGRNISQVGYDLKVVPDGYDFATDLDNRYTIAERGSRSPLTGFKSSYPGTKYGFNLHTIDQTEKTNLEKFGTFYLPKGQWTLDIWDMEHYFGMAGSHYAPNMAPKSQDVTGSHDPHRSQRGFEEWKEGSLGVDSGDSSILWNTEKFENYKEQYYLAKSLLDSPQPPSTDIPWKTPIPSPSHRAGNSFSDQIFTFYEARTFAYARASKDSFSLTCRNGIGNEGFEPVLNLAPVLPEEGTANVGSAAYNSMKFMNDNGNWGMFHPAFLMIDIDSDGTWVPFANTQSKGASGGKMRYGDFDFSVSPTVYTPFGNQPDAGGIKLKWNSKAAANTDFLDKVGRLPYWDHFNPYYLEDDTDFFDNVDYTDQRNAGKSSVEITGASGASGSSPGPPVNMTYKPAGSSNPNIKTYYDSAGLDFNDFPAHYKMSFNPCEKLAPREYTQYIWSPSYSCHPLNFDGSLAKPNDDLPTNTAQYGGTSGDFFGGPITESTVNHRSTASPDRGRYSGNTGGFYTYKYHREMHFIDTNDTFAADYGNPSDPIPRANVYFWWQYEAKRLSSKGITHPYGVVPESNTAFTNMNGEPGVLGQIKNQTAYLGGARNKKTATNAVTFDETNSHPPVYKYWVLRVPMSISAYTPEGD